MKCINCGANLEGNDVFCTICGTQVQKDNNIGNGEKQSMYNYEREESMKQQTGQVNNGNQYNKSKNSSDIKKIIIVLIAVFLIPIIIFAIVLIFGVGLSIFSSAQEVIEADVVDFEETNIASTSSSVTDYGNSGISTNVSNTQSSYKVKFSGFNLYIPDNLIYEIDSSGDVLIIVDEQQTWSAEVMIDKASFEQLKQNKNQIKSAFEASSGGMATVSNVYTETIEEQEYLIMECDISGTSYIAAYTGLNSMNVLCFILKNEDNDFNKNLISNLTPISANAEYVGDSQYLKDDEGINIKDVTEATKKALQEEP